jgi:cytochrome c peroxidase
MASPSLARAEEDSTLGLPALPVPLRASANEATVRLGQHLFFDTRLSVDGRVSCAKCHIPELAFTDHRPHPLGHDDRPGTRNAPSLLNVRYLGSLFWDGRARDLESQAIAPLMNPVEHGFVSASAVLQPIVQDAHYREEFARAFGVNGTHIDLSLVARALSAFERTLVTAGSPFDRYLYGHDQRAMTPQAIRGLELFRHRAQCAGCHTIGEASALLTDSDFHVSPLGIPAEVTSRLSALTSAVVAAQESGSQRELERLVATDERVAALGRFVVTLRPNDIGKFKTPSLRNVALTPPYMHDGSVATLEQAVDSELYARGGDLHYPIALTADERRDLVEFLKALTGYRTQGSQHTFTGMRSLQ